MKKMLASMVLGLFATVLLSGCVPIMYTKSITVHKDGTGKITEIVEQETISEPHSEMPKVKELRSTQFENLK